MTDKKPPRPEQFFGPALAGACLGVILCIPIAAYTAAWLGDTYERRALVYCVLLLWCVAGAVTIFAKTWRAPQQRLTLGRILLWCVSLWLWPLLLAASALSRRKRQ
ncbi:MAG: hypothetical protein ACFWTZ_05755 [Burkholderia sp.]|jgi:MFS family permease